MVSRWHLSRSISRWLAIGALILVLAATVGLTVWYQLFRQVEVHYDSEEEFYKYGSIGLEEHVGLPYALWTVLPELFADKLPPDFAARSSGRLYDGFGFHYEEGHEVPVGVTQKIIGFPRTALNCAACHSGTVAIHPEGSAQLVLGAPPTRVDLQGYQRFLFDCAADPRFEPATLLKAIAAKHDLSPIERLFFRFIVLDRVKSALLEQKAHNEWSLSRPPSGPGRADTFALAKYSILDFADDGTVGNTDYPSIWNQEPRAHMWLHWDGNNNSTVERNIVAAVSVAGGKEVNVAAVERVSAYIAKLPPPKYPFAIDAALAARGHDIYQAQCAKCHAFGGEYTGQVTPIDQVGTDRNRLDSFTPALFAEIQKLGKRYDYFTHYRQSDGYANVPLDGLWARAPYLHHGAVPTMWDLLLPVDERPKRFYRGLEVYDPKHLGYVSQGEQAQARGFAFDVGLRGNGNGGHLWGTDLAADDRWALIEYLKTL